MSAPARFTPGPERIAGAITCFVGGLGIAGWLFHIEWLVQLTSGAGAMQFNTAIGLFLAGLGLILFRAKPWTTGIAGLLLALLGILDLIQQLTNHSFGIERAIFPGWVSGDIKPAPISVNSSVCLAAIGLAYLLMAVWRSRSELFAFLAGGLVISISAAVIVGYLMQIDGALTWGLPTRMSPQSSVALFAVATGLLILSWRGSDEAHRRPIIPVLVALCVIAVTLIVWDGLMIDRRSRTVTAANNNASYAELIVKAQLDSLNSSLIRAAESWNEECRIDQKACDNDLSAYFRDFPALDSIAWTTGAGNATAGARNEKGESQIVIHRREAPDTNGSSAVVHLAAPRIFPSGTLAGKPSWFLFNDSRGAPQLVFSFRPAEGGPSMWAVLNARPLADGMIHSFANARNIAISVSGQKIFESSGPATEASWALLQFEMPTFSG